MAVAKTKKAGTKTRRAGKRSTAAKRAEGAGGKKSAAKSAGSAKSVTIDRRSGTQRRSTPDRRKESVAVPVERRKLQRRAKVNRRRQIDPTTCERDYSAEEIEFMNALDEYKRASGRMFPTCSEVLEVIRNLGYVKGPGGEPAEPGRSQPEGPAEAAGEQL